MAYIDKLTEEYHYKSVMLNKAQVHIKFPHIIYKRKSYDNPMAFFVTSFRIKGSHQNKIKVMKSILSFMHALDEGKVDFNSPSTYYPLYVLESRWLLKYSREKFFLNAKGRQWRDALKETIELYEHRNEDTERPAE